MRARISRSFWGIQRRSFVALDHYLKNKFYQRKNLLLQKIKQFKEELKQIEEKDYHVRPSPIDESLFHLEQLFTPKYKKCLFGLNQRKVMEYVRKLKRMQEEEFLELRHFYEAFLKEKKELLNQLPYNDHLVFNDNQVASTIEILNAVKEKQKQKFVKEKKELAQESLQVQQEERIETENEPKPSVGGNGFWEEEIDPLLNQPYHPYQFNQVQHTAPTSSKTRKSPAIADQAYNLRKRYIVGKIAGGDLKGSDGKVIVAKNSIIIEEIIRKAEEEGKLAELIVNMIVPGLGE